MRDEADQAIQALNGYTMDGSALNVNEARPKPDADLAPARAAGALRGGGGGGRPGGGGGGGGRRPAAVVVVAAATGANPVVIRF